MELVNLYTAAVGVSYKEILKGSTYETDKQQNPTSTSGEHFKRCLQVLTRSHTIIRRQHTLPRLTIARYYSLICKAMH